MRERLALRVIQVGVILAVLAVSPRHVFDLDRFLVPKELVLHGTALLAALFAWPAIRRVGVSRSDKLLAIYLGLGLISTLFATNRWLGWRAFAVSVSSVLLLLVSRGLRESGLGRAVLKAVAIGVVLAAVTSLLQAYGMQTDFFALNRAPGGTLGNRNFVAHVAAFGMPIVIFISLSARRFALASTGVLLVSAVLVLTRSRAAWLAAAFMLVVYFFAILVSPMLRKDSRVWRRAVAIALFAVVGGGLALLLPNALHWRSDNPYLESVKGVANYEKGSGHGRLIQYRNSLMMALRHPLFGVGPGNWPVEYPRHVRAGDRSLDPSDPGMTFNPWPSSDWFAFVSERGIAATIVLALFFLRVALAAFGKLRSERDAAEGAALLALLAAALVAGAFDAVLLLALPSIFVWLAVGALWPEFRTGESSAIVALIIVVAAIGVVRSGSQLAAMEIFATHEDRASLTSAAHLDPGNYMVQMRLARRGKRQERCEHALAARKLFPLAEAAREVSRGCK